MVQIMNCQNVIFMHRLEYHIHYFLIPNNSNQTSFENTCGKQKTDLIITCVKNLFIDTHIPRAIYYLVFHILFTKNQRLPLFVMPIKFLLIT